MRALTRHARAAIGFAAEAFCSGSRGHALSTSGPAIPQGILDVLAAKQIALAQVPGAGRGLISGRDIDMGANLLTERPYVCHPALANLNKVCYHCLAVLGPRTSHSPSEQGFRFCSSHCLQAAELTYLKVEADGRFQALHQHCQDVNLRFPLLVKRVAASCVGADLPWVKGVQDLNFLAYSSVPHTVPQPWMEAYRLLCQGLQQYRAGKTSSKAMDQSDPSLAWFLGILSRLQINVFRVDCIFPLEGSLQSMAAAVIGGHTDQAASGSALYRAAALFNHSCDPNMDVNFPGNDGEVAFTAARSISEGEQLCISYIDATLPARERQQQLFLGYGFKCNCSRCQGESATASHDSEHPDS